MVPAPGSNNATQCHNYPDKFCNNDISHEVRHHLAVLQLYMCLQSQPVPPDPQATTLKILVPAHSTAHTTYSMPSKYLGHSSPQPFWPKTAHSIVSADKLGYCQALTESASATGAFQLHWYDVVANTGSVHKKHHCNTTADVSHAMIAHKKQIFSNQIRVTAG